MKLEVVVVPVSDVDRAKDFYTRLGFREDIDAGRLMRDSVMRLLPPLRHMPVRVALLRDHLIAELPRALRPSPAGKGRTIYVTPVNAGASSAPQHPSARRES